MAKTEHEGGGDGGSGGLSVLAKIVRPIVAKRLTIEAGRVAPVPYGHTIRMSLTAEELASVADVQSLMLESVLADQVRRQTRPRSFSRIAAKTGELFPEGFLDDWISADPKVTTSEDEEDEDGDEDHDVDGAVRIKIRHGVWSDHQIHRENQIKTLRRANSAFEVWEQRRGVLRRVGMSSDPTMTTAKAVEIIKKK